MRRPRREGAREAGMSVVEVVLLAPLVIGFIMILVIFGVLVNERGNVQGAARDAARMGSLQRDEPTANRSAHDAAVADLTGDCDGGLSVTDVNPGDFVAGGLYTVRVDCTVSLAGLDWFNLGAHTITAYSTAPLDAFRRTG